MSKTYRDSDNANWLRSPKTHGYRRDLLAAEEEIKEELGPNYLRGNFAKINNIPTAWQDIRVSGIGEYPSKSKYMEREFKKKIDDWVDKEDDFCFYSVDFDCKSNTFWIGKYRGIWTKRASYYLPTSITVKGKNYPVKIKEHLWR